MAPVLHGFFRPPILRWGLTIQPQAEKRCLRLVLCVLWYHNQSLVLPVSKRRLHGLFCVLWNRDGEAISITLPLDDLVARLAEGGFRRAALVERDWTFRHDPPAGLALDAI